MKCREIERWLTSLVDGELEFSRQKEVELHLKDCPSCQTTMSTLAEMDRVLRSDGNSPSDLEDRILHRLEGSMPHRNLNMEKRTMILRKSLMATAIFAVATFGLLQLTTPSAEAAYDRMHAAFQKADGVCISMVRALPLPIRESKIWIQGGSMRIEQSGSPTLIVRNGYQFSKGPQGLDRSVSTWSIKEVMAILDFRNVRSSSEAVESGRIRLIGTDRLTVERLVRLQIEPEELVDWATRMSVWIDQKSNLPLKAVREAYVDDRWQVQLEMRFEYSMSLPPGFFDPKSLIERS